MIAVAAFWNPRRSSEAGKRLLDPCFDPVHGELMADDARRGDQRPARPAAQSAAAARGRTPGVLSPSAPVAALALPELITTARMSSDGSRSRHNRTGAAQTRLVVNVPAAAHVDRLPARQGPASPMASFPP